MTNATGIVDAVLDLLLPALCPLCGAEAGARGGLCQPCRDALPLIANPCPRCAAPRTSALDPCRACGELGLTHLASVTATLAYRAQGVHLITRAKAHGDPAAVAAAAALIADPSFRAEDPPLAILVVPATPGRRHGPHLATACARVLARRLGLPLSHQLRLARTAVEQHRLPASSRRSNVAGLFTVRGRVPAHVVLVDDLLTSGATASAAAGALKAAGARRVSGAFLARTPKG